MLLWLYCFSKIPLSDSAVDHGASCFSFRSSMKDLVTSSGEFAFRRNLWWLLKIRWGCLWFELFRQLNKHGWLWRIHCLCRYKRLVNKTWLLVWGDCALTVHSDQVGRCGDTPQVGVVVWGVSLHGPCVWCVVEQCWSVCQKRKRLCCYATSMLLLLVK